MERPLARDVQLPYEAAQEWVRKLPSASDVQQREFARWITQSPKHLQAYLMVTALETELAGLKGATQIDLESLLSQISSTVTTLPDRSLSSAGPRSERSPAFGKVFVRPGRITALAAGIATLALCGWLINRPLPQRNEDHAVFTTDIGQQRSLVLPDGTDIQLNTNSLMRTNYSVDRRNLTLSSGEVAIRVARDPNRPFAVQAGPVRIKDVGTEFTVRNEPNEITVFVTQGKVQLSVDQTPAPIEVELAQNQEAVIGTSKEHDPQLPSVRTLSPSEVEQRLAWKSRKLVLNGEELSEVVREINRYHKRQLVITDTTLEHIKVGGMINPATNDYRVLVEALGRDCPILIDDSDPAFVRLRSDRVNGVCRTRHQSHAIILLPPPPLPSKPTD